MRSSSNLRLLGLDHLRAFAALLVFFWHGYRLLGIDTIYLPADWISGLFEEGYVGVDLFICITGFVFTILTTGRDISYFGFLKNRFLRLFPLLFLTTLMGVAVGDVSKTAVGDFFNLLGAGTVWGTWTLVIEFQFYLAYPFMRDQLVTPRISGTLLRCGALIGLFLVLRGAQFVLTGTTQDLTYFTIIGRVDEFVFGILAGLAYLRFKDVRRPVLIPSAAAILVVAAAVILWAQYRFNLTGGFYSRPAYPSSSPIWIWWQTVNAPFWAALICCYCLLTQGLSGSISRAVAYVGAVSYSTYMLHFLTLPLFIAIYKALGNWQLSADPFANASLIMLVFLYPATLAVSAMSYETIEKSFFRLRANYLLPRANPVQA